MADNQDPLAAEVPEVAPVAEVAPEAPPELTPAPKPAKPPSRAMQRLLDKASEPEAPPEPPAPEREQTGERVTFYSPRPHLSIRFPFRPQESHLVASVGGGPPKLVQIDHPRDCARFKPNGSMGVVYATDDPDEIEFLEGRMNSRSEKFDPTLRIGKREPIFKEVTLSA